MKIEVKDYYEIEGAAMFCLGKLSADPQSKAARYSYEQWIKKCERLKEIIGDKQ